MLSLLSGSVALGAGYTWDASGGTPLNDGGGSWNASGGTNWFDGTSYGAWGNTTADTATFGVANGAAGTITVGNVTANALTFNAPGSGNYTLSSGTITLAGTSPTMTVNASGTTTISTVLAGSSDWTKSGGGTLLLSGSNSYTGRTTIANAGSTFTNGNRLLLANPTGPAIVGPVTIGNNSGDNVGAVLTMAGANQFGADSVVTFNNPSSGQGYFQLNGFDQTVRGVVAGSQSQRQTIQNLEGAAVGAATLTLNASAGDAHVFRGLIRRTWNGGTNVGALNFVKTGSGTQTLAGPNVFQQGQGVNDNYIGNVTVNQGTLVFENATSAGSGNASTTFTSASGATLEFAISSGTTHNIGSTATGGITLAGAGTLRKTGSGMLALSNQGLQAYVVKVAMSDGGLIDVQGGTLRNGGWQGQDWTNNRASLTIASSASFDVWDGSNPTIDALNGAGSVVKGTSGASRTMTVGIAGGSGTFSGTIDDAGGGATSTISLTKVGSGTQTLSGANTYRGTTTVSAGVLRIGAGGTTGILSSSTISVGSGGTLAFNRTDNYGGSFATLISGSGGVRVESGFLTLAGLNTFTGATNVLAGGTLAVNGSLAGGGLTIASGAALMGSGTIAGLTTIAGLHRPGNSPGVETFTNLTYNSGANVQWELWGNTASNSPTAFDQVVVNGNLTFSGGTTLDLMFTGSASPSSFSSVSWADAFWDSNQEWLLYDVAGTLTTANNLTLNVTNWQDSTGAFFQTARPNASFAVEQRANDVYIVYAAVPEPGTLVLAGVGVVAVVALRCRRRRRAAA